MTYMEPAAKVLPEPRHEKHEAHALKSPEKVQTIKHEEKKGNEHENPKPVEPSPKKMEVPEPSRDRASPTRKSLTPASPSRNDDADDLEPQRQRQSPLQVKPSESRKAKAQPPAQRVQGYNVTVHTGLICPPPSTPCRLVAGSADFAGTTAIVFITIYGTKGDSSRQKLSDDEPHFGQVGLCDVVLVCSSCG
jgi:hypothetical protein